MRLTQRVSSTWYSVSFVTIAFILVGLVIPCWTFASKRHGESLPFAHHRSGMKTIFAAISALPTSSSLKYHVAQREKLSVLKPITHHSPSTAASLFRKFHARGDNSYQLGTLVKNSRKRSNGSGNDWLALLKIESYNKLHGRRSKRSSDVTTLEERNSFVGSELISETEFAHGVSETTEEPTAEPCTATAINDTSTEISVGEVTDSARENQSKIAGDAASLNYETPEEMEPESESVEETLTTDEPTSEPCTATSDDISTEPPMYAGMEKVSSSVVHERTKSKANESEGHKEGSSEDHDIEGIVNGESEVPMLEPEPSDDWLATEEPTAEPCTATSGDDLSMEIPDSALTKTPDIEHKDQTMKSDLPVLKSFSDSDLEEWATSDEPTSEPCTATSSDNFSEQDNPEHEFEPYSDNASESKLEHNSQGAEMASEEPTSEPCTATSDEDFSTVILDSPAHQTEPSLEPEPFPGTGFEFDSDRSLAGNVETTEEPTSEPCTATSGAEWSTDILDITLSGAGGTSHGAAPEANPNTESRREIKLRQETEPLHEPEPEYKASLENGTENNTKSEHETEQELETDQEQERGPGQETEPKHETQPEHETEPEL